MEVRPTVSLQAKANSLSIAGIPRISGATPLRPSEYEAYQYSSLIEGHNGRRGYQKVAKDFEIHSFVNANQNPNCESW